MTNVTDINDLGLTNKMGTSRNLSKVANAVLAAQAHLHQKDTFRKNRLSVDPIVFPASKLEALAQVQVKTLEKEMTAQYQSLKSPRKSNQKNEAVSKGAKSPVSKLIFAPRNGVYNQTQLLQNPELAKQKGINFFMSQNPTDPSALGLQTTTIDLI